MRSVHVQEKGPQAIKGGRAIPFGIEHDEVVDEDVVDEIVIEPKCAVVDSV
jgi:hypothetical protein